MSSARIPATRVRGGVDPPAWVREGGERYVWGPLSLLVSVS
jgi:hypothetical protein